MNTIGCEVAEKSREVDSTGRYRKLHVAAGVSNALQGRMSVAGCAKRLIFRSFTWGSFWARISTIVTIYCHYFVIWRVEGGLEGHNVGLFRTHKENDAAMLRALAVMP